jgi:hypothetical protein
MWQRRPIVTAYRVLWVILPALFLAGIFYALFFMPADSRFTRVDPAEVRLANEAPDEPRQQTPASPPEPSKVDVDSAEMTIASADGFLKMHLWADTLQKDGPLVKVTGGLMQFDTEHGDTLLLSLTDASYQMEQEVLHITGELRGVIKKEQLQFTAREVRWDRATSKIVAQQVELSGPVVNVTGDEMEFDMLTGILKFNGPVRAGL